MESLLVGLWDIPPAASKAILLAANWASEMVGYLVVHSAVHLVCW